MQVTHLLKFFWFRMGTDVCEQLTAAIQDLSTHGAGVGETAAAF